MNKLTTSVQIVVNEKYNTINTVDVLNTVMSGLVLKPTSDNQFETNQRYSSSDTLIQLINKFIQNRFWWFWLYVTYCFCNYFRRY